MVSAGTPKLAAPRKREIRAPLELPAGGDAPRDTPVRIAIACMTKRPANFESWLSYHREVVGVERFYLRVEDTPWLERAFREPPWRDCVRATFAASTVRDWTKQTQRQTSHVSSSIREAAKDGMTHLLHIDDDEILFCAHGREALRRAIRAAGPTKADLHALTIEALSPSLSCSDPFRECRAFRHDVSDFCSYGADDFCSGKSMGCLAFEPFERGGLCPKGPHHFSLLTDSTFSLPRGGANERDDGSTNKYGMSAADYEVKAHQYTFEPGVALIIHYESTHFGRWRDKFGDYARRQREEGERAIELAKTFNKFYKQSIVACSQLCEMGADGADGAVGAAARAHGGLISHFSASDAEDAALAFWRQHKLEPADLPRPSDALEDRLGGAGDGRDVHEVRSADGAHRVRLIPSAGVTLIDPPPAFHLPPCEPMTPPAAACSDTSEPDAPDQARLEARRAAAQTGRQLSEVPLTAPRARRWRVEIRVAVVREAPLLTSRMIDLVQAGAIVEADAETRPGAHGIEGTWVRLAEPYAHGLTGWMLIDAGSVDAPELAGVGVVIAPVSGRASGRLVTLGQLIERAQLPADAAADYAARLVAQGAATSASAALDRNCCADLQRFRDTLRRVRMPVGHRLRLEHAYQATHRPDSTPV